LSQPLCRFVIFKTGDGFLSRARAKERALLVSRDCFVSGELEL